MLRIFTSKNYFSYWKLQQQTIIWMWHTGSRNSRQPACLPNYHGIERSNSGRITDSCWSWVRFQNVKRVILWSLTDDLLLHSEPTYTSSVMVTTRATYNKGLCGRFRFLVRFSHKKRPLFPRTSFLFSVTAKRRVYCGRKWHFKRHFGWFTPGNGLNIFCFLGMLSCSNDFWIFAQVIWKSVSLPPPPNPAGSNDGQLSFLLLTLISLSALYLTNKGRNRFLLDISYVPRKEPRQLAIHRLWINSQKKLYKTINKPNTTLVSVW
jgi:hypothetical protein